MVRQGWLVCLLLPLSLASPSPSPPSPSPVHALSTSLIDLLSSSPSHTLLLKAVQRARLVPLINRLNGSTFFAPDDEAIRTELSHEHSPGMWSYGTSGGEGEGERDNLQLALRDTLLYHLLNYTLFPSPNSSNSSVVRWGGVELPVGVATLQETLYRPTKLVVDPTTPAPPTVDSPFPVPGGGEEEEEGMLNGAGQRLRVERVDEGGKNGGKGGDLWIGRDAFGRGGTKVGGGSMQWAANGAFVSLGKVLVKPKDLAYQIKNTPELSTFYSLLPDTILDYLSTANHLTLFLPTNDAWSRLGDLEMRYLRSGFAEADLTEIFSDSASRLGTGNGSIAYLEDMTDGSLVSTLFGSSLMVSRSEDGSVLLNGTTRIITGDILASNGVLHTVPSLLLPPGAPTLSLTAEKYLIALNATRFVGLLRSVNLSHYVQIPGRQIGDGTPINLPVSAKDSQDAYTILAPRDDVLNAYLLSLPVAPLHPSLDFSPYHSGAHLPPAGSPALKAMLSYHIVAGKWKPTDLEDGMLVGTELRSEGLKGGRQRLSVSVNVEEMEGDGWEVEKDKGGKGKSGVVGFGGASVLSDPVTVGKSIIYIISAVLEPPASIITTAVSDLRLSTFVASIYAASLDKLLLRTPGITYLIPSNTAFTSLGLTMSYLLLPVAREELKSLIKYHAIDEIVYLDSIPLGSGSRRYPTLDGAEIYMERAGANASLSIHGPTIGGSAANGETRDARLVEGDILIETGVLHVIDQVELPPSLSVGVAKLLKGAKANTFADLVRSANMSWVLEGKPPPSPSPSDLTKKKKRKPRPEDPTSSPLSRAYTVLCPTDKALSRLNLTYYLSTPPALLALVQLHIIPTDAFAPLPSNGFPMPLEDEISYPSLLDYKQGGTSAFGTIAFRAWGEEGWMVGIKAARGTSGTTDSARVVSFGRSSPWFVSTDSEGGKGSTRLANGGGVLVIDSVLLPYYPGFFRRNGWIIALVGLGTGLLGVVGLLGWKLWRGGGEGAVRLEGEED